MFKIKCLSYNRRSWTVLASVNLLGIIGFSQDYNDKFRFFSTNAEKHDF